MTISVLASLLATMALPARSGYTNYFLGKPTDHVDRMIEEMGANGFTAIDVKIQSAETPFDLERHKSTVKGLIDRAKAKGLAFNVYLYPIPYDPGRAAEASDDPEMWKTFFAHAFQFAKLHHELGFHSLRFDIETIHSYHVMDEARLEAVRAAVAEFARALRAVDPTLPLGYMPADHHAFSWAFDRALAAEGLPTYLDAWDLYNGEGYLDSVGERAAAARAAAPGNRFIAWFRPNSYRPTDIAVSAYHTLKNTDGYSMWCLDMLDDPQKGTRGKTYDLPDGLVGEDYWREFRKANDAFVKGEEIPYRKIEAVVPPLEFAGFSLPPADELPYAKHGKTGFTLREPRNVFVRAKAGDGFNVTIAHLAGSQRPIAIHYALIGPDGKSMRDESVSPGGTATFSVGVPADGVYALVLSGGTGGQAWYNVAIDGLLGAVDARSPRGAELFGPQKLSILGSDRGNPVLRVRNSTTQAYSWRVNEGDWQDAVGLLDNDISLPAGRVKIEFRKLEKPGYYCQDFILTFPDGKRPYVFPYE